MAVKHHHSFLVPDRSFASITKRDITRLAESFGFSEGETGKINIIVSEMLTNLAKFSPEGGELLVKPIGKPVHTLEILCLDSGPGMSDAARMMQDGVTTFGSAGEGLGAIKRQSDLFDIYSHPGLGTIILAQVKKSTPTATPDPSLRSIEIGCVMVPKPHETVCGDGFTFKTHNNKVYLLALDGLGHGSNASEASAAACHYFEQAPETEPVLTLRELHQAIKRTRGAVGFAAAISPERISYCGVGNIAGKLYNGDYITNSPPYKNIISYNGILGHNIPTTLNNQHLEWARSKTLILHSDGLKSRWDLSKYPNLNRHHAIIVAAVLYRDFSRHTDDTLVVVCKAKV
ncbi:SpoIIE family protein phosphatase [Pontibacter vulgaris]|uniref:SpoIIE family protein phosphatase n=1 Tax=Pontibacter vulgaris TaxID=2905679 RepID=UPI001FA76C19|nr:SpoIIE family protein phosphatase [Pontibacter vulgaris]